MDTQDQTNNTAEKPVTVDQALDERPASIDDVIPDAEKSAHDLIDELHDFVRTFELKADSDIGIFKGWITMQAGKIKAKIGGELVQAVEVVAVE